MDLNEYRSSKSEALREADILRMVAQIDGSTVLDVGARDGYFSKILAERFASVTALDLQQPQLQHPRIVCVSGDVTNLAFADDSFDFVLCAEVLEHIPPLSLAKACSELARVTRSHLLVGVPFKQDTRIGRTSCKACGARNPPWGHVNSFDEERLLSLFSLLPVAKRSFVGVESESTNGLSALLMDLAGNPYGTYGQEEPCVACGALLVSPPNRSLLQKVCTKAAFFARRVTEPLHRSHPYWMHLLFRKR